MRPKSIIEVRIKEHLLKAHLKSGDSFTLAEDMKIVNHVLKNRTPREPNDIKTINSEKKNWMSLESELERKQSAMQKRWHTVIYPRILGTGASRTDHPMCVCMACDLWHAHVPLVFLRCRPCKKEDPPELPEPGSHLSN